MKKSENAALDRKMPFVDGHLIDNGEMKSISPLFSSDQSDGSKTRMEIKPISKELDLIGVISPVCILKCKSELARMNAGSILEVLLQDPEVVEELIKIVQRSKDRVIKSKQEGDHYRIWLKKE
ncbi:sulfurtransferase TusA family protein [Thermodesulfobacteriota bacterium]